MYRVFLGAPSKAEIYNDANSYQWHTISSSDSCSKSARLGVEGTQSLIFPLATLEAASHRISLIYKNIIFDDASEMEDLSEQAHNEQDELEGLPAGEGPVEQTTLITWPPTAINETRDVSGEDGQANVTGPSFLSDKSSAGPFEGNSTTSSQLETQPDSLLDTQESFRNYSDASSIARFPTFHFNLHSLTSLSQLSENKFKGSIKVNVLLAVLEVEGPDTIRIKKGREAGKEIAILKMILGDEEGTACKLTAWREVAEEWGGSGESVAAKRGDIVHIENIMATSDPSTSILMSASQYLNSKLTICYRTMPYTHEDGRLRPDLRLGESDPSVRKVATIVLWFQHMAGLPSIL